MTTNKQGAFVIGDIHGELGKLKSLLANIKDHMKLGDSDSYELIFVGDYIDRGPDSFGVLSLVRDLVSNSEPFTKVTALMGNHEDMMIRATAVDVPGLKLSHLKEAHGWGETWLCNGGWNTIESFGGLQDNITNTIGPNMLDFVKSMPLWYETGAIAVTHAGIDDPDLKCEEHSDDELLWSRVLRTSKHNIYKFTVHGHTPFKRPMIHYGIAYIDTGCGKYKTGGPGTHDTDLGALTALYIPDVNNPSEDTLEILQAK